LRGGGGACVRPRKPLPGGFGHHVRRYYGRCAGCFRWTGTGARRATPPRAASQETWPEVEKPRPRNLGQSRGGAPEGERADRKARAASEDAAPVNCAFRRSASLRFYFGGSNILGVRAENSDADASRERDRLFTSPRVRGEVEGAQRPRVRGPLRDSERFG
jgi:hypothetical protein